MIWCVRTGSWNPRYKGADIIKFTSAYLSGSFPYQVMNSLKMEKIIYTFRSFKIPSRLSGTKLMLDSTDRFYQIASSVLYLRDWYLTHLCISYPWSKVGTTMKWPTLDQWGLIMGFLLDCWQKQPSSPSFTLLKNDCKALFCAGLCLAQRESLSEKKIEKVRAW